MRNKEINTGTLPEEAAVESSLRPQTMEDYIGQDRVKKNLRIAIDAAKNRGESLDHVLFYGPPGLGKTTLAGIIANEMGTTLRITSGPAIEKTGDIAAVLAQLNEGDVLFIDEIHRLSKQIEEFLYTAMEDFAIDILIGKEAGAKTVRMPLPRFTLVGATTRAGLLSAPLRDRFGVVQHLEYYSADELKAIIINSASRIGVKVDPSGATEMACRSRGTPRIANRLLRRVRDYAEVKCDGNITKEVASDALDLLDIDSFGLDLSDRKILEAIVYKFNGGPVGLDTLAASVGEDSGTIEEVIEPFLVMNNFINRTPKGRVATDLTYSHLGVVR